jgi:protein-disulfide isomerase
MKKYAPIFVLLVIVGTLIGIYQLQKNNNPLETGEFMTAQQSGGDQVDERDIIGNANFEDKPSLLIGSETAKVRIIEYADFKCPQCARFHADAGARVRAELIASGNVALEFRNYPFIGPDSGRAARGSYCAERQDVFEQYHDTVYEYMWEEYYRDGQMEAEFQDVLTADLLVERMKPFLSDSEAFRLCLDDQAVNAFIDADLLLGADDEVNATPGFVIGGKTLIGPQSYSVINSLVDIELRKTETR